MKELLARWQTCPPCVRHLLLGEFARLWGSASAQVGMAWWIAQAGGAHALALYGGVVGAGSLLTMPLLSPLGDRFPKHLLMQVGSALLLMDGLLLLGLSALDIYHLPLLCLCSLVAVSANAVLLPAQTSALPEMISTEGLPGAIRLRRAAQSIGGMVGPGLAGLVLAAIGTSGPMVLNVLALSIATATAYLIRAEHVRRVSHAPRRWMEDLWDGFRAKWGVRMDRNWSLIGALMMIFLLPATGLLLPLRVRELSLSSIWFGACGTALSLGVLAGVLGGADFLIQRLNRVRALYLSLALCSAFVAAMGWCSWGPGLVALFFGVGMCTSVTQLVGQTHRALAMPEEFRARMTSANLASTHLAATVAPAVAGLLLLRWPVHSVYVLMGAGLLASSALLFWAVPELRAFLHLGHAEIKNWYGRIYPEAFRSIDRH